MPLLFVLGREVKNQNLMKATELPHDSMQARVDRAGIKTVYPNKEKYEQREIKLEYNSKQITRPDVMRCVSVCKKEFGIDI